MHHFRFHGPVKSASKTREKRRALLYLLFIVLHALIQALHLPLTCIFCSLSSMLLFRLCTFLSPVSAVHCPPCSYSGSAPSSHLYLLFIVLHALIEALHLPLTCICCSLSSMLLLRLCTFLSPVSAVHCPPCSY